MEATPQPAADPRPLRFAANLSWLFTEMALERRFDAAASAGFRAIELAAPYRYPAARLRQLLDDAGLEQILINTPAGPNGSPTGYGVACWPDRVAEFRDGARSALEYATTLGSKFVHVLGGMRPAYVGRDDAQVTYQANLEWTLELAAGTGVTIVIEALNRYDAPNFVLDSVEHAASIVRGMGNDSLRLLFDVYHCQRSHGSVVDRLGAVLPIAAHVQIADAPGRNEPGSGTIDWAVLFDELRTREYAGWIGCEYRPRVATAAGLRWRAELAAPPTVAVEA
jgi:hydroxypyruvate isomerase